MGCQSGFGGGGGGGGGITGVLTPGVLPVAQSASVLEDSIASQAAAVLIIAGGARVSDLVGSGTRVVTAAADGTLGVSSAGFVTTAGLTAGTFPIASGAAALSNSSLAFAAGVFTFTGNLSVSGLAGSGTRVVVADSAGVLTASSTLLSGSAVSGQVTYWNGTSSVTGSVQFLFTNGSAGVASVLDVKNTNTSNLASGALIRISAGPNTGGDPQISWFNNASSTRSLGIDSTDGVVKFDATATLGTSSLLNLSFADMKVGIGNAVQAPVYYLDVVRNDNQEVSIAARQIATSSGSSAKLYLAAATAGFDPYIHFFAGTNSVSSGTNWIAGVDGSASSIFGVWSGASSPGAGVAVMTMTVAGAVTFVGAVAAASIQLGGGSVLSVYTVQLATVTLSGCTTVPSTSARMTRIGNIVTVSVDQMAAVSNSMSCTIDGWPAALLPANTQFCQGFLVQDNGITYPGQINVSGSSSWTIQYMLTHTSAPSGIFTAAGNKGMFNTWTFTYSLQ